MVFGFVDSIRITCCWDSLDAILFAFKSVVVIVVIDVAVAVVVEEAISLSPSYFYIIEIEPFLMNLTLT